MFPQWPRFMSDPATGCLTPSRQWIRLRIDQAINHRDIRRYRKLPNALRLLVGRDNDSKKYSFEPITIVINTPSSVSSVLFTTSGILVLPITR